MYSYDDRLRAVRLYIKLGRLHGLTVRQLGYPTKNALKTWYSEYEQRNDLSTGYVRQPMYSQTPPRVQLVVGKKRRQIHLRVTRLQWREGTCSRW